MTDSIDDRRRAAAVGGFTNALDAVRSALSDTDATVRATALGSLERLGSLDDSTLVRSFVDADVGVRRRVAELAATHADIDLLPLLADDDPTVVEIAAWSCGEHGLDRDEVVDALIRAANASDALVRESAVAALGAIGAERAVSTIIAALATDKPAVRRRAVLALAPFTGEAVDAAIAGAMSDRDWQVRQAAECLVPNTAQDRS